MSGRPSRRLTLADVADVRAYERDREMVRAAVIGLKAVRRVRVAPMLSVVFENRETVLFQVQEMARAERITSDAGIQAELDAYESLVPGPGEWKATLFLELRGPQEAAHWLPRLVGIEHSLVIQLTDGTRVRARPVPSHARQLSRHDVTSAVHFVEWSLTDREIAAFGPGSVLLCDHPELVADVPLAPETCAELAMDLSGNG